MSADVTAGRPALADLEVGQVVAGERLHVDRARLVEYAAASGDRNRIHWDERFAVSVGLPDVIAHGMFTMGAAGEVASRWAGGGQYVRSYATRFTNPVVVPYEGGAEVEVSAAVKKIDGAAGEVTLELTVTHEGTKVLGRALAVVAVASGGPDGGSR